MSGEPPPSDAKGLRARADRCRKFAREYSNDVGASLNELAVELDLRAGRLEEDDRAAAASLQPRLPEEEGR